MIKARILSVDSMPQNEAEFESHGKPMYPMAWMCTVQYENGAQEQAKVTVNGRSRSGGYCKKFIAAGCYIVSADRGEYNGVPQLRVESKETKEANGESGQWTGGSGGGQGQPSGGQRMPSAQSSGPRPAPASGYTFKELVELFERCYDASLYVQGGETSEEALQAGTATLFIQATRQGLKAPAKVAPQARKELPPIAPPQTGQMNDKMRETLDNLPPPPVDDESWAPEDEDVPW